MIILQYNIQSLHTNKVYLEYFANNHNCDIIVLSEIFSDSSEANRIINYNLVNKLDLMAMMGLP